MTVAASTSTMRLPIGNRYSIDLPQPIATAVKRRGKFICWQLQFDFTKRIEPLPYQRNKKSKRTTVTKPIPSLQQLEKGIRDRDEFIKQVGIPEKYDNMLRMARRYIIKAVNKSRTMRGMSKDEEADLAIDFLHDTIAKVCRLLERGEFKGKGNDHAGNLCGYCYRFIELDAKRYVAKLDEAGIQLRLDNTDTGIGYLGNILSELPAYLEGHEHEFADFAHAYIFDWLMVQRWKTTEDQLACQLFRMYYGTSDEIKDIAKKTGYSKHVVMEAYKSMLEYVKAKISTQEIIEAFGRKIMEGCQC